MFLWKGIHCWILLQHYSEPPKIADATFRSFYRFFNFLSIYIENHNISIIWKFYFKLVNGKRVGSHRFCFCPTFLLWIDWLSSERIWGITMFIYFPCYWLEYEVSIYPERMFDLGYPQIHKRIKTSCLKRKVPKHKIQLGFVFRSLCFIYHYCRIRWILFQK